MNFTKIAIIGSVILVVVFVFLLYLGVIPGFKAGKDNQPYEIEIWGVFDDSSALTPLIEAYQAKNPNATVIYRKKNIQNYEKELIRAFAAGRGPDIFMIHNTWVPKLKDILYPAPQTTFSLVDFRKRFVDVVQKDFAPKGPIYGVPLYVDTLALYYNIDLFNSAGLINPPKTWEEFEKYSKLLTKKDEKGEILVSGASIGSGKNVLYSQDILALLMMQRGQRMSDESGKVIFDSENVNLSVDALDFYTKFARKDSEFYSWDPNSKIDSQDMFALGRVAMMFGYSWTKYNILQKSPRLRFDVAYIPQKKDRLYKKNYADYWGYGVHINSPVKNRAWDFLKFLADPKNASFYLSQLSYPASQKSILAVQQNDRFLSVFADQALTADSWLQLDNTLIKDVIIKMIDQHVVSEQSASVALKKAVAEINSKILSK